MDQRTPRRAGVVGQVVMVAGLVIVWMLLWGQFTWLSLVTGVLLAIGTGLVFYLPPVDVGTRVNLWYAFLFFVRLVLDIVRASVVVAWTVLKPRYTARNAIAAVRLRTRSDLILTFTAEAISVVPGSIVVDVDRAESVLYVHILDVDTEDDVEGFVRSVLDTERRVVLAVGTRADVQRVLAGARREDG